MQNSAHAWTSSLSYSSSAPLSSPISKAPVVVHKAWSSNGPLASNLNKLLIVNQRKHSPSNHPSDCSDSRGEESVLHLTAQLNLSILHQVSNQDAFNVAKSIGSTDSPVSSNCSESSQKSPLANTQDDSDIARDDNNNRIEDSQLDQLWNIASVDQLSPHAPSKCTINRLYPADHCVERAHHSPSNEYSTAHSSVEAGEIVASNCDPSSEYLEKSTESNQKETRTRETSDKKKDKSISSSSGSHCSSVDINYSTNHCATMHPSNSLSTLSSLQQPSLLQLTANSIVQMSNSNMIGASGTNGSSNSASSASGSMSHRRAGNGRNKSSSSSSNSQPGKSFLCHVCHRTFTQKGNLKTHMMIHSGDKPYACNICGKSFTQKGNVDTHMKIHTGEKDYSCRSCGKGFTQRGNLKTHERSVHTKEKPYACTICGKAFSQKGNMVTHLRTHNKDDRFPCDLCGKTFSQKGNLKTHKLRHSGTLPARKYGQRRQNANRVARGATPSHPQHNNHHHHHAQGPSGQQQLPLHLTTSNLVPGAVAQSSASSGQFAMNHSASNSNRPHLKSTDEESESSSVEHSMDGGLLHASGSHSSLLSPGRSSADASGIHVSTAGSGGLHHSLNDSNHIINRSGQPSAPLTAFGFANHRFYSPSTSTISAPQAHLAATAGLSWLTSVAASSATAKSRMANHHHHHHHHHHTHDSFGLNAAAAYTAAGLTQHPNHNLARLTLLPATSSAHHNTLDHHLSGGAIGVLDKTRSSSDHHSAGQAQNDYHTSPQVSTAPGQPNPDFSQLLD